MTTTAEYRAYANEMAKRLAAELAQRRTPVCVRITNRRGHGYSFRNTFTVPKWCFDNPHHRDYYIIHEVLHCFGYAHGSLMRVKESELMEQRGARLQYMGEVYPQKIVCLQTGADLYVHWKLKKKLAKSGLVPAAPVLA